MRVAAEVLGASILVVDGLPGDARLVASILSAAGYWRVSTSLDSRSVPELHRAHPYDLVILDLAKPHQDGFAVMAELAAIETGYRLPVLAMTTEPDESEAAFNAGARDFIDKPIRAGELLARVQNMLEVSLERQALARRGRELEGMLLERTANLRESEEPFRMFAERVPEALWIRDTKDRVFHYVNRRFGDFLGRPLCAGDRIDKVLECLEPGDRERVLREIARLPHGGVDVEARFLHSDGSERIGRVRTFTIADDLGVPRWIGGILQDVTLRNELESANLRLRSLSERILAVQEEERRVVSAELHDDVGQAMVALQFGLHRLVQGSVENGPALLTECEQIVLAVQGKLRALAARLHPPQLLQLGLQEALRGLVSRQRATTGLNIRCVLEGPDRDAISPSAAIACFRICQEALSNATRHAQAALIEVRTTMEAGRFCLSVQDDGAGFDAETSRESVGAKTNNMGLVSMEERARLAGGELDLRTAPGAGTVVIVKFPRARASAPLASAEVA